MKEVLIVESVAKIVAWAEERNLIEGATAKAQMLKFVSETGEWARAVVEGDQAEIVDGIGDAFVVLTIVSKQLGGDVLTHYDEAPERNSMSFEDLGLFAVQGIIADAIAKDQPSLYRRAIGDMVVCLVHAAERHGTNLQKCIDLAYLEIKDRKGVMFEGVFIKESDPRYDEVIASLAK